MSERRITVVLVALVLVAAAAVRFWGLGFGLPLGSARPDETALAGPAVAFLSGDLRPDSFYYPSLYKYALAILYLLYYWLSKPFAGFPTLAAFAESRRQNLAPFFYLNRGLSAAMGTLTVWWVYALGRRAFDETVGLVAAFFLAFAALHVRDSHFGTTDVTMTALVVAAVLAIVRWQQRGGNWRDAALAGLVAGLATSTKYNGLGVWVPFAVAALQMVVVAPERAAEIRKLVWPVVAFGVLFLAAFFATSPYILLEWPRFLEDVTAQGATLAVGHGLSLPIGWVHHALVTLPAALGWPLFLAGVAGIVLLLATRFRQSIVVLAFPLVYYAVAGDGHTVFARYMLPVLPFLAVSGAWLTVTAVRTIVPARRPWLRALLLASVSLAMAAPTAVKTVTIDRIFTRTDNRVVAARAVLALVPPGSTFYQSGEVYGQVPLAWDGRRLDVHLRRYDAEAGRFVPGDSDAERFPEWILVQRSPLVLYSAVPARLEGILRERYELVASFEASDARPGRVYDLQDAFFLPLDGLAGVTRLGPNFDLYRRKAPDAAGASR